MDIRIYPQNLGGTLQAIPSKSHSHRLLIAAALSNQPTEIRLAEICEDVARTVSALRRLGMGWEERGNGCYRITPLKTLNSHAEIDCGSSGTTLRLLLPIVTALGGKNTVFYGSEQLQKRPIGDFIAALNRQGAAIEGEALPVTVTGSLKAGDFQISGNVSSQYISGLLYALPLLAEDSTVTLTAPLESAPYVDLTVETLKQFRIEIKKEPRGFFCKGNQSHRTPEALLPEGDWSNAAFWLAAGALGGEITLTGLNPDSKQGDKAITELLKAAGTKGTVTPTAVTAAAAALAPFTVNASRIPDLVPILAVLACAAPGTSEIRGASRLRLKESDRLQTVADNLTALGAEIEITADGLKIHGGKPLKGGTVSACGDHRLAMCLTVAAGICKAPVVLTGAEAVAKSYPSFYSDFKKLGGRFDVL